MEDSRHPNFYGLGGEDEDYRRFGSSRFLPHQRSISEQNHLANNATAVQSEYMRRQHSGTAPMRHQQSCLLQHGDISSADSHSRICSRNVTAGETELMRQQQLGQGQHDDISSVDTYSRRKIPAINKERMPRKREVNRAHMEIGEEHVEILQAEIGKLKVENESLRQENIWWRKQFDDVNKKYEEQHECNQTLETENRRLKDKYIELLEKSNPLVVPGFGIHSNELGQQRVPPTTLSQASACGSVNGKPVNPF